MDTIYDKTKNLINNFMHKQKIWTQEKMFLIEEIKDLRYKLSKYEDEDYY